MIRHRAAAAGIAAPSGCHTFRATGITAYFANGGALEHAQEMAAHESPRTTKLYDRTKERLTQDEVERIRLKNNCKRRLLKLDCSAYAETLARPTPQRRPATQDKPARGK